MLVVDASVLVEVLTDGPAADVSRARLAEATDLIAPHLIDAEVLSVLQAHRRRGLLDETAALQAVDDLASWPGERWPHRPLLHRAWELRDGVRGYDALYVALAEAAGAPLLTLDRRLARSPGPRCTIEVPGG